MKWRANSAAFQENGPAKRHKSFQSFPDRGRKQLIYQFTNYVETLPCRTSQTTVCQLVTYWFDRNREKVQFKNGTHITREPTQDFVELAYVLQVLSTANHPQTLQSNSRIEHSSFLIGLLWQKNKRFRLLLQ